MPASHVNAFIAKLWRILSDRTYAHLIHWDLTGSGFMILNPGEFSATVLPVFFKHSNLSSFIRQLNAYEFRKCSQMERGEEHMEYRHPHFLRGRPDELAKIKRKSISCSGSEASEASSSQAPGLAPMAETARLADALEQIRRLEAAQVSLDVEWNRRMAEVLKVGEERSEELETLRAAHSKQQKAVAQILSFLSVVLESTAASTALTDAKRAEVRRALHSLQAELRAVPSLLPETKNSVRAWDMPSLCLPRRGSCPAALSEVRAASDPVLLRRKRTGFENFFQIEPSVASGGTVKEEPESPGETQPHQLLPGPSHLTYRSGGNLSVVSNDQSARSETSDDGRGTSQGPGGPQPPPDSVVDQFAVFLADIDANLGGVAQQVEEAMDSAPPPDTMNALFSELARNDSSYDSLAAGSSASNLLRPNIRTTQAPMAGTKRKPLFAMGAEDEDPWGVDGPGARPPVSSAGGHQSSTGGQQSSGGGTGSGDTVKSGFGGRYAAWVGGGRSQPMLLAPSGTSHPVGMATGMDFSSTPSQPLRDQLYTSHSASHALVGPGGFEPSRAMPPPPPPPPPPPQPISGSIRPAGAMSFGLGGSSDEEEDMPPAPQLLPPCSQSAGPFASQHQWR